ncbi:MAG: VCBS repeat-containing protein [Verrucomicrobia bacterium]|nr:VCBS repeat-containing protein [Verrucomicrobiota bacterium]
MVTKATPTIAWNKPADIAPGTPLSGVQLSASASLASQTVSGQYSYSPPAGTVLPVGDNQILGVFFVPDDSANINFAGGSASINVRTVVTTEVRGDIDGDGKPDLLFQDSNRGLAAWLMNGATLSSAKFLTPESVGDNNWRIVGSGDFNGDNQEDLVFQHTDGSLAVWIMNGVTSTSGTLLNPSNPGDRNWRVAATGDVDKDGKADLVFQHTDGTLAVWIMNGINLKSAAVFNPSNPGNTNWKIVGTGDFDSDGKLDLLFQHTDGTLAVWFLDGTALSRASVLSPANPGADWRVVSAVDRNGDGKPDLLFQHTNRDLAVWFLDGTKLSSSQYLNPQNSGGTWKVVAPK